MYLSSDLNWDRDIALFNYSMKHWWLVLQKFLIFLKPLSHLAIRKQTTLQDFQLHNAFDFSLQELKKC